MIARGDWAAALGALRAVTCVWTIVRKTGLRFHTVSALPAFLSRATSLEELALHGHGEVLHIESPVCDVFIPLTLARPGPETVPCQPTSNAVLHCCQCYA